MFEAELEILTLSSTFLPSMALAQHLSINVRHQQQVDNAREFLLPFLEEVISLGKETKVMEIGCGEGGVLIPFIEKGMTVVGVDLNEARIRNAKELNKEAVSSGQATFLYKNVYDEDFLAKYKNAFDLIVLKDTIEHIPEQEKFIPYIKQFLRPEGKIFFGFPPWRMPFGGHQQICQNKFLSVLPYYHLLPRPIYRGIVSLAKEPKRVIDELMDIKSTRISIDRFERIVKKSGLTVESKTLFLLNPIYKYKFGWKPIKQAKWLAGIPWFRDFLTTAGWYIVG